MTRITNKLGLPEELYTATKRVMDEYDKGDCQISATGLSDPPRKQVLEILHEEELEEDVSDLTFALLGTALHQVLRDAFVAEHGGLIAAPDHWVEQRLFATCQGWKISGAPDLYRQGMVRDYKVTSVYSLKNGKPKQEWSEQLNTYAWLLRENGLPVTSLEVNVHLRDWSKMDSIRDGSYPRYNVARIPVPLWTPEEAEEWVTQRVMAHQAAYHDLPLCSPSERWEKPGKWALMKTNAKRAIKLFDTHAEAVSRLTELKGDFVQQRPGMSTRCFAYCNAARFCTQFQNSQKEAE